MGTLNLQAIAVDIDFVRTNEERRCNLAKEMHNFVSLLVI